MWCGSLADDDKHLESNTKLISDIVIGNFQHGGRPPSWIWSNQMYCMSIRSAVTENRALESNRSDACCTDIRHLKFSRWWIPWRHYWRPKFGFTIRADHLNTTHIMLKYQLIMTSTCTVREVAFWTCGQNDRQTRRLTITVAIPCDANQLLTIADDIEVYVGVCSPENIDKLLSLSLVLGCQ